MNNNLRYKLYKRILAAAPKSVLEDNIEEFAMMRVLWLFDNKRIVATRNNDRNTYFATVSDCIGNQITTFVGPRAKKLYEHGQKSL